MTAQVKVNLKEFSGVSKRVQEFLSGLEDLDELKHGVGLAVVSSTQKRFEDSVGPDGTSWAEAQRGGKTLVDSGLLRDSVVHQVDGDRILVGSNRVYAGVHQFGAEIKPKTAKVLAFSVAGKAVFAKSVTIPARPYLGINEQDRRDIRGTIADFVLAKRREAA